MIPAGFGITAHPIFQAEFIAPRLIERHSIVDRIDSIVTKEEKESVSATLTCAICLSSHFQEPVTLNCLHSYCRVCILEWFKSSLNCPLCKAGDGSIFFVAQPEEITERSSQQSEMKLWRVSEASASVTAASDGDSVWPRSIRGQVQAAIRTHRAQFGRANP